MLVFWPSVVRGDKFRVLASVVRVRFVAYSFSDVLLFSFLITLSHTVVFPQPNICKKNLITNREAKERKYILPQKQ